MPDAYGLLPMIKNHAPYQPVESISSPNLDWHLCGQDVQYQRLEDVGFILLLVTERMRHAKARGITHLGLYAMRDTSGPIVQAQGF